MILILGLIGIALFGPVITFLLFIIGSLLQALGAKNTAASTDDTAAQARAKANAEAKAQAKQKIAPPPSSHTPQWACQQLGIAHTRDRQIIQQAWRKKMQQLHPDHYQQHPAEVQEFVHQKAQDLNQARNILLDR